MVSMAAVALRTCSSRSTAACCICKRKSRRLSVGTSFALMSSQMTGKQRDVTYCVLMQFWQ